MSAVLSPCEFIAMFPIADADMTVKALKTEARVTFFEECATRGFAPLGPVTINHQPAQRAIYCRMRVAANPNRNPHKTPFQLGESA